MAGLTVDGFGDGRRFQSIRRYLMDFRGSRVVCLSDGFDSTIVLQGGRLSLGWRKVSVTTHLEAGLRMDEPGENRRGKDWA